MKDRILIHHGIKGQKWGVKHGPPYPLKPDVSARIRMSRFNHEASGEDGFYMKYNRAYKDYPPQKMSEFKKLSGNEDMFDVRQRINHYDPDDPKGLFRAFNCPNCAAAFDMVERGYDVQARPKLNGSNVEDIESFFVGGKLINAYPDCPKNADLSRQGDNALNRTKELLLSQGVGARGIFVVGWREPDWSRTSCYHAMNYKVERITPESDPDVTIYDAQSWRGVDGYSIGRYFQRSSLMDPREIYVMRTDNLEPSEAIEKAVYSR